MADYQTLLDAIKAAEAAKDIEQLTRLREDVVAHFPDSDIAAESWYKLGLHQLYQLKNLDASVHCFTEATKKKHTYWSSAARISLALCLHRQQKQQKAFFELRKVGYAEHPNIHSVTALMFLETLLTQDKNQLEVVKVRKDRIQQLELLLNNTQSTSSPADRGALLMMLGIAYQDQGDKSKSKKILQEALAIGPNVLDPTVYKTVTKLLNSK